MPIQSISNQDASKITSGQVIVDLTAIVKELIDNAIDAESDKIDVTLNNYGAVSVEVSDNGLGIDPSDFSSICLKHHTSKLHSFEDLESMTSLGFRGEAMSSLCAMARVSIVTCSQKSYPRASMLEYDSMGTLSHQKSSVTGKKGTTVSVSDIFNGMPVRQKNYVRHIKREYSKALSVMMAYLVAYPHIRFTLYNISGNTGKRTMVLGTQGLRSSVPDVLVSLYGSNGAHGLVPIEFHIENIDARFKLNMQSVPSGLSMSVKGFISDYSFGMGRGATDRQFFSINSRPVTHKRLSKIANEVYRSFNATQSPVFVLNLTLDPSLVDVNVTPDKRSVMMQCEDVLCEVFREELTSFYNERNNYVPKSRVGVVEMGNEASDTFQGNKSHGSDNFQESKQDEGEVEEKQEGEEKEDGERERDDEQVEHEEENEQEENEQEGNEQEENEQEEDFHREKELDEELGENQRKLSENLVAEVEISHISAHSLNEPDSLLSSPQRITKSLSQNSQDADEPNDAVSEPFMFSKSEFEHDAPIDTFEDLSDADLPPDSPVPPHIPESIARPNIPKDPSEPETQELFVSEVRDDSETVSTETTLVTSVNIGSEEGTGTAKRAVDYGEDSSERPRTQGKKPKLHKLRRRILLSIPCPSQQNQQAPSECKHMAHLHDLSGAMEIKKQDFLQMKVIGQFNFGFIIVKHDQRIFIVDQHASDEIYNYEMLMNTLVLRAQPLVVPRVLELSAIDEMVILQHLESLQKNGFILQELENGVPGRRVQLVGVPVSKNIVFDDSDMHELVHKLHEHGGDFKQEKTPNTPETSKENPQNLKTLKEKFSQKSKISKASSVRCTKVDKMIASRACRSSIMIGQALSRPKMSGVVKHLSTLEKPWNCPHGRPTVRHLADLQGDGFSMDYEL